MFATGRRSGLAGYARMEQFISNAAKLTVVGVAFLAGTAITLMYTIERTFNSIWRVRKERRAGRRLVMYIAIIAIGPVLIGLFPFDHFLRRERAGRGSYRPAARFNRTDARSASGHARGAEVKHLN